jgi:hypothetical protein
MSPIKIWGNHTWIFFHVLVSKLKNVKDDNSEIIGQTFSMIKNICINLPCPICATHAKEFLSKIQPNELKTKEDLINLMYCFHNTVNKRKKKTIFKYEDLKPYEKYNLAISFNNFAQAYNTKGDIKNISESFYRTRLLGDLKKWLVDNKNSFTN